MTQIDFERARFNMVEQQVRPWEVLDQRVLDAMSSIPREEFVPPRYKNLAFADVPIPLGQGQVMMRPNVEGRALQALELKASDSVLEVGTGSGYLCACLAHLARHVTSVDIFADFTAMAKATLAGQKITNVLLETGDAASDWGDRHFDAIVITGALYQLPNSWRERLAVGGRLVVVVGQPPVMEAIRITRQEESHWSTESLFETELSYLIHGEPPQTFQF